MQKDLLTKQNKSLTEEIKKFKLVEEEFQIYRDKFNSLLKEKSNKDNLSLKQEEKLKSFEKEIDILNKECQNKDEKYKKLDEIYLSVIKVIEEHKKTIYNLKNKIKIKEAEENNKKMMIFQKEQEIALLRSFINSYKNDIKSRFKNRITTNITENSFIPKLKTNRSDLELISNKRLEQKLNNYEFNNKNLPRIDNKININNKKNENIVNDNNNLLRQKLRKEFDDKEEENIKDISNMMNKMIND